MIWSRRNSLRGGRDRINIQSRTPIIFRADVRSAVKLEADVSAPPAKIRGEFNLNNIFSLNNC